MTRTLKYIVLVGIEFLFIAGSVNTAFCASDSEASEEGLGAVILGGGVIPEAKFSGIDTKVQQTSTEVALMLPNLVLSYKADYFNWDNEQSLPFIAVGEEAWKELHTIGAMIPFDGSINDKWNYFFIGGTSVAFEENIDNAYLVGFAALGFEYDWKENMEFVIGPAVVYKSVVLDTSETYDLDNQWMFAPVIGVRWNKDIKEGFWASTVFPVELAVGYRSGDGRMAATLNLGEQAVEMQYGLSPTWATSLSYRFENETIHRLKENSDVLNAGVTEGYLINEVSSLDWLVHWNPNPRVRISLGPTYVFNRTLEIRDRNDNLQTALYPDNAFGLVGTAMIAF